MKTVNWSKNMSPLPHDPADVEDYAFGWIDWLGDETIASHTVDSDELTVVQSEISGPDILFRISGPGTGRKATVDVTVTSSSGRVKSRSLPFEVQDL